MVLLDMHGRPEVVDRPDAAAVDDDVDDEHADVHIREGIRAWDIHQMHRIRNA